jgi:predicted acetyltransferase
MKTSNRPALEAQPQVELRRAEPHHEPILANLLELYIHDFTELLPLELGDDGRFGYPQLSVYWSHAERHAFLIYIDKKLAGLAMVKRERSDSSQETVWDMAEFFIVRTYRRSGAGTKAACAVWDQFPGPWQVRVMQANSAAVGFWQSSISTYIKGDAHAIEIEKDGQRWLVFRFEAQHS